MKYVIFAICVLIIIAIRNKIFAKIDKDEEQALRTPGRADYIRANYQEVVDYILSNPNYHILFERADMIKIGVDDSSEYFAINNYSGGLLIALVKRSSVMKEWKFSRNESSKHIIYTIKSNSY
jgi:hypothetical protein